MHKIGGLLSADEEHWLLFAAEPSHARCCGRLEEDPLGPISGLEEHEVFKVVTPDENPPLYGYLLPENVDGTYLASVRIEIKGTWEDGTIKNGAGISLSEGVLRSASVSDWTGQTAISKRWVKLFWKRVVKQISEATRQAREQTDINGVPISEIKQQLRASLLGSFTPMICAGRAFRYSQIMEARGLDFFKTSHPASPKLKFTEAEQLYLAMATLWQYWESADVLWKIRGANLSELKLLPPETEGGYVYNRCVAAGLIGEN